MNEKEKKELAFIAGMLAKSQYEKLNLDEVQALENISEELGFYHRMESEFRY